MSQTSSNAARSGLIPKGAFVFPVDAFQTTREFAFLLLPDFTLLAFSSALEPFLRLPPYQFMAAVREARVALIDSYMLSSVTHHRIEGYERLARELHPERFEED